MKKLLILSWCLYFSATCKQIPSSELVFVKANNQSWSGGAAGSGHGINYNFYFVSKSHSLAGDSVWVQGYVLPVTTVISGDTIHFRAMAFFKGQMGGHPNDQLPLVPKKENPPLSATSAAIISYSVGKIIRYAIVIDMKRLQPISYP